MVWLCGCVYDMCVRVRACMHALTHACMHVCMHACLYVYVCIVCEWALGVDG